jgi:hypothetical protein
VEEPVMVTPEVVGLVGIVWPSHVSYGSGLALLDS